MIYLGGSCSSENRTMMTIVANFLRNMGKEVYCPFELKIENAWDYSQEVWAEKVFDTDIKSLRKADTLIVISPGRISSAGTNWEQGFAYALRKRILVFQYTEETTSLMTYVGSDIFVNTSQENLLKDIYRVLEEGYRPNECKTILT